MRRDEDPDEADEREGDGAPAAGDDERPEDDQEAMEPDLGSSA